eukprot:12913498-Prorocentrum_lima.AAC.1
MASSCSGEAALSAGALVRSFARTSHALEAGERAAMARLCEVAKSFLARRAGELVDLLVAPQC